MAPLCTIFPVLIRSTHGAASLRVSGSADTLLQESGAIAGARADAKTIFCTAHVSWKPFRRFQINVLGLGIPYRTQPQLPLVGLLWNNSASDSATPAPAFSFPGWEAIFLRPRADQEPFRAFRTLRRCAFAVQRWLDRKSTWDTRGEEHSGLNRGTLLLTSGISERVLSPQAGKWAGTPSPRTAGSTRRPQPAAGVIRNQLRQFQDQMPR